MRHKFVQMEIPAGQTSIEESCLKCGHKRRRTAGGIAYPYGNGKCSGLDKNHKEPERSIAPVIKPAPIAPVKEAKPWDSFIQRREPTLTDTEARLKECLVILRVLYDESVAFPMTKGRQMAGRFLYSQGYQDIRKAVEQNPEG